MVKKIENLQFGQESVMVISMRMIMKNSLLKVNVIENLLCRITMVYNISYIPYQYTLCLRKSPIKVIYSIDLYGFNFVTKIKNSIS